MTKSARPGWYALPLRITLAQKAKLEAIAKSSSLNLTDTIRRMIDNATEERA